MRTPTQQILQLSIVCDGLRPFNSLCCCRLHALKILLRYKRISEIMLLASHDQYWVLLPEHSNAISPTLAMSHSLLPWGISLPGPSLSQRGSLSCLPIPRQHTCPCLTHVAQPVLFPAQAVNIHVPLIVSVMKAPNPLQMSPVISKAGQHTQV